jgi:signal transduction histidine kinase
MAKVKSPTEGRLPLKHAHFQINSALFEELGERLVSKPEVALAELIKNAYDADSQECRLTIEAEQIIVADIGHGMTENEFLNHWMVVSSPAKGIQRFSRTYARSMAGSKGVGRFSARFLGNVVELLSVAYDPFKRKHTRLRAVFDWNKIARVGDIEKVDVTYTVEDVPRMATGTTLTITSLRTDVARISAWTVKSDILRLTDPSSGLEKPPFRWNHVHRSRGEVNDPGFSVLFTGELENAESEEVPNDVAASIINNYVGRVRLQVDEIGHVQYKVYWRGHEKPIDSKRFSLSTMVKGLTEAELRQVVHSRPASETDERGLPIEVKDIQHLPLAEKLSSPVFIDLRFFPRRKGTYADLGVNGTKALGWVGQNAGFPVVDNNFAMADYADPDSDWLGIDASKARNERDWQSVITSALYPMDPADKNNPKRNPMLALPRGRQIIGRIYIATSKLPADKANDSNNWLQPNMDRESLRSNGAYRLLWHIARFAAELIAHHDRELRLQEEDEIEERKRVAARESLANAIKDVQRSKDIEPSFKHSIVEQLRTVRDQIDEVEDYSRDAQTSLELMAMMGIMAGFMTHEFDKATAQLQKAVRLAKRLAKLSPAMVDPANQMEEAEAKLGEYIGYMQLFTGMARTPQPSDFYAKAQVTKAVETLVSVATNHDIELDVDINTRLQGPFVPVAAYHGIVINLVSNAMKALISKVATSDRKLRIFAYNDANQHVMVVADNGVGIPEFVRNRIWDPLFTTTANPEDNSFSSGLGLGLGIVRRVVTGLKGKIELMGEAPDGFTTAFKVTLPLSTD